MFLVYVDPTGILDPKTDLIQIVLVVVLLSLDFWNTRVRVSAFNAPTSTRLIYLEHIRTISRRSEILE